ncbi:MAG: hypothetical protein Q8Q14_03670 [Gemmatimonadales bacterium]|nr:hypothetical protein [Gemmatimonadales bacterium]
MAAYDPEAALAALTSFLKGRGRIKHVQLGEPKAPPTGEITAALMMESIRTVELVLDAADRVYEVTIRLYRGFLEEDGEQTELELAQVVGALMNDLDGDADLGQSVRAVDVGGIYSGGLAAGWAYLEMGDGTMYRTVDVTVPLIVDGDPGSLQH